MDSRGSMSGNTTQTHFRHPMLKEACHTDKRSRKHFTTTLQPILELSVFIIYISYLSTKYIHDVIHGERQELLSRLSDRMDEDRKWDNFEIFIRMRRFYPLKLFLCTLRPRLAFYYYRSRIKHRTRLLWLFLFAIRSNWTVLSIFRYKTLHSIYLRVGAKRSTGVP